MKLRSRDDAHRPRDLDDLLHLSKEATDHDWSLATEGVELVASRGFSRGRDLRLALAQLRGRA